MLAVPKALANVTAQGLMDMSEAHHPVDTNVVWILEPLREDAAIEGVGGTYRQVRTTRIIAPFGVPVEEAVRVVVGG